jgi:hypothetical protein
MADIGGEHAHKMGSGLKKLPKPVLFGGAAVVIGGVYYFKKKQAATAAATASAPTNTTGGTDPATGQSYASELAAAQANGGAGYASNGYGGGYDAGSGSSGIDPTDLASIISAIAPNGVNQGGVNNGASATDPNAATPAATSPVGGGAPSTAVPGVITAPAPTYAPTPTAAPSLLTTAQMAALPIEQQIADVAAGKAAASSLGSNAQKVYAAGDSTLAQYTAQQNAVKNNNAEAARRGN